VERERVLPTTTPDAIWADEGPPPKKKQKANPEGISTKKTETLG